MDVKLKERAPVLKLVPYSMEDWLIEVRYRLDGGPIVHRLLGVSGNCDEAKALYMVRARIYPFNARLRGVEFELLEQVVQRRAAAWAKEPSRINQQVKVTIGG